MNILKVGLCAIATLAPAVAGAEEIEPAELFKKVIAAYEAMETYSSEGTVVSEIDRGANKTNIETAFSIKLKKPKQYLISWEQQLGIPNFTQAGAVWSDGQQPFLYVSVTKSYSPMKDDQMALTAATGVSVGAAHTIPSLFLSIFNGQSDPFARLVEPKLSDSEGVEEDECYVVTGSSAVSAKETYWISKRNFLIRKYSRSLESPAGGTQIPEMTDERLEQVIKASGQDVNEQTKESMKKLIKQAENQMKTVPLKGVSTELHKKIDSPKFADEDFSFKIPAGTVLTKSPLGDAFDKK